MSGDTVVPNPFAAKRQVLEILLQTDLGFHGVSSGNGPHSIHAFAAKFPPQLPRLFIDALTEPRQVVLDPMAGSGTSVVEALAAGRTAIAVDLDPLAILITSAKTRPLSEHKARKSLDRTIGRARALLAQEPQTLCAELTAQFDDGTREFIDFWFTREIQVALMALRLALEEEESREIRDFLKVIFSSIIVTKSGGVSLARDLAHTRPHRDLNKRLPDPMKEFARRGEKSLGGLILWQDACGELLESPRVMKGDSRRLPLQGASIDLIVTSPPYANAIDYMRAHKFSLVWFGYPLRTLTQLRSQYIGAEVAIESMAPLPAFTRATVASLAGIDETRGTILKHYFQDMRLSLQEMYRVLRIGAAAIVVVGPSQMRGIQVNTHSCLTELMASIGFQVVGSAERQLDRDKRQMPASFENQIQGGIGQRIHREFVIAGVKVD